MSFIHWALTFVFGFSVAVSAWFVQIHPVKIGSLQLASTTPTEAQAPPNAPVNRNIAHLETVPTETVGSQETSTTIKTSGTSTTTKTAATSTLITWSETKNLLSACKVKAIVFGENGTVVFFTGSNIVKKLEDFPSVDVVNKALSSLTGQCAVRPSGFIE
jgi:hypothetical protein